jgi:hypothetical protein
LLCCLSPKHSHLFFYFSAKEFFMHIEPGVVQGIRLLLGFGTALTAGGLVLRQCWHFLTQHGLNTLLGRTICTSVLVFAFFEILPSSPVGVSEVHLILGSTLFLLFGLAPTALGLALGLLAQGVLLAPWDLPQYGMNVTTLLLPLFIVSAIAERIVPKQTAYQNLSYGQVLQLSLVYQGGIVSWVAFWALYGQGFGAENTADVLSFGTAYISVIVLEPLIDLSLLAGVKMLPGLRTSFLLSKRLFQPA